MKTMGVQTEVAGTVVSRGRGILVKSRQGATFQDDCARSVTKMAPGTFGCF
jgi:hypothetical protein